MKYLLPLIAVILTMTSSMAICQTVTSEGVLLIDKEHALRGGQFLGTVELANDTNYYNDGQLASDVLQKITDAGGNALQIRDFCKIRRKNATCKTFGEIYHTDSNRAQIIPLKQHVDSLHATLGFDRATEAIIILFSSPRNTFAQMKSVFFFIDGVEGCSITEHAVCSFIMKGSSSFAINIEDRRPTSIRIEAGKAYFFEVFVTGTVCKAKPVRLDYGYRICKAYQQIHDKQRLGQFATEDYEE